MPMIRAKSEWLHFSQLATNGSKPCRRSDILLSIPILREPLRAGNRGPAKESIQYPTMLALHNSD